MTRGLDGQSASLFLASTQPRLQTGGSGAEGQGPDFRSQSSRLLAEMLEAGDVDRSLSESLAAHGGDLRRAFAALPVLRREAIQNLWGRSACTELLSLAGEDDPELLAEGLYRLGGVQERRQRPDLASLTYEAILSENSPAESASVASRARARREVLAGGGSTGAQAEVLLSRFAQEATEPTSLLAMGVAGAAFKMTRLATLGRLVSNPSATFLTRGFGARALASVTAFGVEATVFPFAGRLGNASLGRQQDWSMRAMGRDLASSFLFLGAMKLSGWASGAAFNRLHGINPASGQALRLTGLSAISRPLVPQAGMLGGIMVGHELEVAAGLREAEPGANTLMHSLAMLLQFNVAGRMTRSAFGEGFHSWEQGMERQTQILGSRTPGPARTLPGIEGLGGLQPALAMAGDRASGPRGPEILMMSSENGVPGSGSRVSAPAASVRVEAPPASEVESASRALDRFREHRPSTKSSSIQIMAEALRELRNNPEAARVALIGREDLSFEQLNELSFAISPQGNRVLTAPEVRRVLIPNRGEIAHRIARGLHAEGLVPVVLVPAMEAQAGWVSEIRQLGGEVRIVEGETPHQAYDRAYKDISSIVEVARDLGAQAVHPGYGYRSESPEFARALEEAGLALMGPSVASMERAGDKDIAKQAFIEAGVPVVPGTRSGYTAAEGLVTELSELGMIRNGELAFPLRLKAVAGGGGRGQRTVHSLTELRSVFPTLSAEAVAGFGSGSIMAERFVPRFHHVEFQIMADRFGNVVHLGERECTLQERGQKLIEIHPAEIFERFPGLRERMAEASLGAARAMEYTGHGTVEFMVDPATGDFFAMEVNARIQVEHRVSEAVTGFDLIREAIRVSRGLPLSRSQAEIQPRGAAVEIRIKAVDPTRRDRDGNAAPAPGLVEEFRVKGSSDFAALAEQGIFVETSVRAGDRVSPYADPMIAKLVVTGESRRHALERAAEVLGGTVLRGSQGFASDLSRQLALLRTRTVLEGSYDNRFVDQWTRSGGEDLSSFAHTESRLLLRSGGTLNLHVGGSEPLASGRVGELSQSVQSLLSGVAEAQPLSGPLAGALRSDAELRSAFADGSEAQGRWLQVSAEGELRQAVLYENSRPRRLLFTRNAAMPTGVGQQMAERAVVYDIHFNAEGNAVQEIRLQVQSETGLAQTHRMRVGDFYLAGNSETGLFEIFSQPSVKTPLSASLRLFPAGNSRGLEVRDPRGNILVSLAPAQVLESPSQRLLSLFEFSASSTVPDYLRARSLAEINTIVQDLASQPSDSPVRQTALRNLGSTPISLVRRLLRLSAETRPVAERQLLDEILARREISGHLHRHEFLSYEPINDSMSLVHFRENASDGSKVPRFMIRVFGETRRGISDSLGEAVREARRVQAAHPETRDNVIEIVSQNFSESEITQFQDALNLELNAQSMVGKSITVRRVWQFLTRQSDPNPPTASADSDPLHLKRLTLVVDRGERYPGYFTFRRQVADGGERQGPFLEDTRFRNHHPMLAHYIELDRLKNFELDKDFESGPSERNIHLFYAQNKSQPGLEAGSDHRLFARVLIPEAELQRSPGGELRSIPAVERAFVEALDAMHGSLQSRQARQGRKPFWNNLFLNIQPVLAISDAEVAAYAETLAVRYEDRLRGLGLEKVVVKGRLRDGRAPDGYRTVLVRITNPTGYQFEPVIHNVVQARVEDEYGAVTSREVLIRNGTYEDWLQAEISGSTEYVVPYGEWLPADIPIRPATTAELREQRARMRGAVWAYRIPELVSGVAESFRVRHGLGQARVPGSERPPEPLYPSEFVELELDPATLRTDVRTRLVDYNHGELVPALDARGQPRAPGHNQAGVVIGIQTDHLGGTRMPLRRVMIMGDLTHKSRGSLSANECARINAAIRLAAREGIPVDWFTASSGAEIHERRGVEGLDATASTVREIVQNAHSLGVPINLVVDDVNIGAQSYWNSLASVIHNTGGVLIMTPRGSMALTGPDAWTAAMQRHLHSEDLPAAARRFYPRGLQSLAGYEVHGPNAEAMAMAPNLAAATEMLLRHHYYSYRLGRGQMVGARLFGQQDAFDRDITVDAGAQDRSVGDEIQRILTGSAGSREAILEALRDRGSPEPLRWWQDAEGIRHQQGGNGLMPQKFNSLIQEMQIGGRPTMVIFPPLGPLAPADSEVIGRAIQKANGRMPILVIGSLTGFNGDPRSMENRQLFGGATIAQAIVNQQGPITVVNMGYIVGGTFVVVSKQLNPHLRMLALEGSHAQVIGGPSAAKVVFRSKIREAADADPRVVEARQALESASAEQREARSEAFDQVRREVIAEIEQSRGAAFDQVHSVQRATEVGSVDEVIRPEQLREAIIRHQEEALREYNRSRDAAAVASARAGVAPLLRLPEGGAFEAFRQGLIQVYGEAGARDAARQWTENLRNFLGEDSGGPGSSGNEGTGGEGPASPP